MARKSGSYSQTTGPKVRAAATRLIADQGYAAVSMRQIAAEVGLQAGALYSYTADKQSLLLDLIENHLERRAASWGEVANSGDPVEQLERFVQHHLTDLLSHPDERRLVELELRNLNVANLAKVSGLIDAYTSDLTDILAQGAKAKTMAVPDPGLASDAVLALLNGVAAWEGQGDGLPEARLHRISWNMVRRAVGAKGFQ